MSIQPSPRPTIQNGQIWGAEIANASINPVIDGADRAGSIPLVTDANMSNVAGNLKPRTYSFLDRMKLSAGVGLSVVYSGYTAVINGNAIAIPSGFVPLAENSTQYIFINQQGQVVASPFIPDVCYLLGRVTTNNSTVTSITDLRDTAVIHLEMQPRTITTVPTGSFFNYLGLTAPSGYLLCQGQELQVNQYPSLFNVLGYRFGGSGNIFNLPDLRGRFILGASSGAYAFGQVGGSETVTLTPEQIPRHIHGVVDNGHTHSATSSPHSHGISDPGHRHTMPVHQEGGSDDFGGRDFNNSSSGLIQTENATTGITGTQSTRVNVSVQEAISNIAIAPSGGNQPHNNMPPFFAANVIVKS